VIDARDERRRASAVPSCICQSDAKSETRSGTKKPGGEDPARLFWQVSENELHWLFLVALLAVFAVGLLLFALLLALFLLIALLLFFLLLGKRRSRDHRRKGQGRPDHGRHEPKKYTAFHIIPPFHTPPSRSRFAPTLVICRPG